jgi:hypothetical protein
MVSATNSCSLNKLDHGKFIHRIGPRDFSIPSGLRTHSTDHADQEPSHSSPGQVPVGEAVDMVGSMDPVADTADIWRRRRARADIAAEVEVPLAGNRAEGAEPCLDHQLAEDARIQR